MIGRIAKVAGAPVSAGLALGRRLIAAAPSAAGAVRERVGRPAREPDRPAAPPVRVEPPTRPRGDGGDRESPSSGVAPGPDLEAAAAAVVDPHIEEEEPELVAEVSEPGVEGGAGPELEIAEPWEGYRRMSAPAVLERLEAASPEEAAAIQLYESMNGNRRNVLDAAARRVEEGSEA